MTLMNRGRESCQQMEEYMSLALDGLLASEEHAHLQAHLARCGTCAALWRAMNEVSSLFLASPMAEPPAHFVASVMSRLKEREARQGKRRRNLFIILSLSALLMVLGLLVFIPAVQWWRQTAQLRMGIGILFDQGVALAGLVYKGIRVPIEMIVPAPAGMTVGAVAAMLIAGTALWAVALARVDGHLRRAGLIPVRQA